GARAALGHRADAQHDRRVQQRTHQQGQRQRATVAGEVAQLLAGDRPQLAEECVAGAHACRPSSVPIALTKASSRLVSPNRSRSSSAVPEATTWPLAMMTMRSHSAATSCMMWLEKITQRPSARSWRRNSRIARVVMTSRPLVGSSRRSEEYTSELQSRETLVC